MSKNLYPVELRSLPSALLETALPVVIFYWDPNNTEYPQWYEKAAGLADEFVDRVKFLTVEMDERRTDWWLGLYAHEKSPYTHTNFMLPTLQVIKTDDERNVVDGVRPGFADRHNFMPAMRAMVERAADPTRE